VLENLNKYSTNLAGDVDRHNKVQMLNCFTQKTLLTWGRGEDMKVLHTSIHFYALQNVIEILPSVTYDKVHFLSILHNLHEVVVSHDFLGDAQCSLKRNGVLRKIKEILAV